VRIASLLSTTTALMPVMPNVTMGSACLTLTLVCCAGGVAMGCRPSTPGVSPMDVLTGGSLLFSDDFERAEIGDDWRFVSANWRIEDGWVAIDHAENDALWLQQALPDDVRIEFDARSLEDIGDIKFEVFGDGATHQSGYVCIFGGWSNQINTIARLDEHGADRFEGQAGVQVVPEQVYRMALVRTDQRVRWFIDGTEFLVFDDAAPLEGDGHRHFGFNNWHVNLRFDNVAVYDLSLAPEGSGGAVL
jgi:hypothetical protein